MAYTHGKQPIMLLCTGGAPTFLMTATTATKQQRRYMATDVVVRAVGIYTTVTKGGAVRVSFRTASGAAASASGGEFSKITLVTGSVRAKLTVRKGLNVTVSAGSALVAIVTTAVTGIIGGTVAYIEPKPFDYANKTQVRLVTT